MLQSYSSYFSQLPEIRHTFCERPSFKRAKRPLNFFGFSFAASCRQSESCMASPIEVGYYAEFLCHGQLTAG
eukprot:scaffold13219_cov106-Skeletonema_marinoi.AAC.18